jgi:hypothetical protein
VISFLEKLIYILFLLLYHYCTIVQSDTILYTSYILINVHFMLEVRKALACRGSRGIAPLILNMSTGVHAHWAPQLVWTF